MTLISSIALVKQAKAWFESNQYDDATRICVELLRRNPKDGDALVLMSDMAWIRRERSEAIDFCRRLVKAHPREPAAHLRMVDFLNRLGRHREAISQLNAMTKLLPGHPSALVSLARTHELMGDLDKALSLIEPRLAAGTETPEMAYMCGSIFLERKEHERARTVLERHVGNPAIPPRMAEAYCFLLGQVYERMGEYDRAFAAYDMANKFVPTSAKPEELARRIDELIAVFSPSNLRRFARSRIASRLPVFIICMPRSGSTLVERIIASHPDVHAGGEREALGALKRQMGLLIGSTLPYPQCVRDLDQDDADRLARDYLSDMQKLGPQAKRITDKNTGAWENVGLISLLFPQAAVIDLRRDPVDNCIGCFTVQLGDEHPFAKSLRMLGFLHRQYERLMQHWHDTLEIPILRVNYEDLVADQETWSRRIIEHCGLEWDDRCLRFYEKEAAHSSTANPTLSFKQVRQPIYKSSVARAKRFEKHIGPLYEALGTPNPSLANDAQ